MSSEDPVASAAEGVTKGVLVFSEEKIKGLVKRFLDKDIAFVEDPETIKLVKQQRKTSEYDLFKQYIDDHDLRILFLMGLTLRRLERKKEQVQSLRDKIVDKYDIKGLHIAQLIQNGFFNTFLANALERTPRIQQLKFEIKSLFDNIGNTVVFVKEFDNVNHTVEEITVKIYANSPRSFMVCGSGSARRKCHQIEKEMKKWIRTRAIKYDWEVYESEFKTVFFLNKSKE